MNISLLRLLSRESFMRCARVYTLHSEVFGPVPFRLECRKRGAGGHYFSLVWFPCWLLNCMWSVNVFTLPGTVRGGEKLRDLLREALTPRNAHYLPYQATKDVRAILEARKEVAA